MRKALISMVLAATIMTPVAAEAQRRGGDRSEQHGSDAGEARSERVQQRVQQREARVAEQPQAQQSPAPVQVVQRSNDGNRGGNRGGDGNRGGNRGGGGDGNRGDWNRGGNDGNNGGNDGNRGGNRGDWNRGGNNGGNDGNRGGNRGGQTSIYPQAWQGNPNDPQLRRYQELERRNQQQGYRRGNDRNDNGRNWRNDGRNGDWNGRRDGRRGDWNRGWRNDNRYNWQYYRRANRNFYHVGPYYSPYRNYRYNRFSVGLFLDALFYDQRYWVGDPWQYRLPPAPYGTQWVRYYNDVMLVDVYTGEVVDVIHDFFW